MISYNDLIFKYKKLFEEDDNLLRKFLYELCNEEGVDLYYSKDEECKESIRLKYEKGVKKLLKNMPLNYVLGYSYFYGYKIQVSKNVLIPRFETEELVSRVLNCYDEHFKRKSINICDIGTGSGAIAIALKKEANNINMYASDISASALRVAKKNASYNECDIRFYQGDMLDPLIKDHVRVDILVSNPPYIKTNENIEKSVKDYEPHIALFGGDDGLKYYKNLLKKAEFILNKPGYIFFEMGYDQKESLSNLVKSIYNDAKIKVFKDISGKNRIMRISL